MSDGIEVWDDDDAAARADADQSKAAAVDALRNSHDFLLFAGKDGQTVVYGGGDAKTAPSFARAANDVMKEIQDSLP